MAWKHFYPVSNDPRAAGAALEVAPRPMGSAKTLGAKLRVSTSRAGGGSELFDPSAAGDRQGPLGFHCATSGL